MKLIPIASNMTEIETEKATILFSYKTPVAACMKDGSGFFRTDCRWSNTTSRHINKWLDGAKASEMPQSFFDILSGDVMLAHAELSRAVESHDALVAALEACISLVAKGAAEHAYDNIVAGPDYAERVFQSARAALKLAKGE